MSTSAYLSNYGVSGVSSDFTVTFEIPDNCLFTLSLDTDGTHLINVELEPRALQPSATFVTQDATFTCNEDGELNVAFVLPQEGLGDPNTTRKPRISLVTL